MAVDFAALKASFDAYTAKVDAYVAAAEQHKTDIATAVADAIKTNDAGEATALADLQAKITAAADKVPAPPASPFEPSNL